jgi:hypothetical protein
VFTTGRASVTSNVTDRAFEQVSPQDKGGQSVSSIFSSQARSDGDAVAYPSSGAFPGAETNVAPGYYIGRRSESGWTTDPVEAPQFNPRGFVSAPTLWFSDDFASAVQFSARALTPGAFEKGGNLYLRNNLTGARTLVAGEAGGGLKANFAGIVGLLGHPFELGATPSLSHFGFTTQAAVLPGVGGNPNAYEYADGQLRLVGILPDGSIPADGSNLGGNTGMSSVSDTARPVSSDGRRVFFSSPAASSDAPIYMRVDGQSTVTISDSHRTGASPDPVDAQYLGASADGSIVYFYSVRMLTDEDAAGIYRLDVNTDELRLITPTGGDYPYIPAARELTADGSTIAFQMQNILVPGATPYTGNEYVYRNGRITYLGDNFSNGFRLSPDGRYVVFASQRPLTGYVGSCPTKADPSTACLQVFRTDLDAGVTTCVSCLPGRDGNSDLGWGVGLQTVSHHRSTRILDDGTVLFESDAPLVAGDVNGYRDVYEFAGDRLRLVSSGKAPVRSLLADASSDGRDVFFVTAESLVRSDTDTSSDLYDARRGGGIPAQNQEPDAGDGCDGDSCQGTPEVSESAPGVGSVTFAGPGDPPSSEKTPKPVGAVKVTKPKTIRGSEGSLKVKLRSAGRLTVSGSGTSAVKRAVSKASSVTVKVALTAKARKTLKRRGVFKTRLRIAFTPTGGKAQAATVSVTFEVKR